MPAMPQGVAAIEAPSTPPPAAPASTGSTSEGIATAEAPAPSPAGEPTQASVPATPQSVAAFEASSTPPPVAPAPTEPALETPSSVSMSLAAAAASTALSAPAQMDTRDDCNAVARARADDAAANGYSEELQQVVHDRTYADCTAWNAAHR